MTSKLSETQKARKKQKERAAAARAVRAERDKRIMAARRRKVTIEDIAEQEGITHQRVSQIISKNKKVKK